jgi:glycosyltransferase involved in cell wall biosynthesis
MAFTERSDVSGADAPGVGCSVGIMAYNEEANIADAIGAILHQKLSSSHIAELIVVASGCEDRTVPIVSDIARHDPRVRLPTCWSRTARSTR